MKELGIVIPAYNAHDTIRRLLHSIGCFNFLDKVKVVIVDDASKEPYDYLLEDFKDLDIHLITLKENVGPGFAR
jgi:glycosyltransferase involved in cell wall biosynthesis